MQTLTFQNITLTPAKVDNQIWLTSAELAKALGYAETDSVTKIYNRNSDEFTGNMTTTVKMTVVRKTGKVEMDNRIFSLRGCHLIAMFARTKVAKEFRQWVLDILDKEVGQPVPIKTTADDRTALRQAVSMLVGKKAIGYDEAYRIVHQYMGVSSIDEIALDDLPKAVAYVHSLVLADTHNHNDQNAFWRMVGLLEYDRIHRELIALQKVLDTAQQSLNHIVKTSGLLYDGFGEQYLPTKAPVVDEARAFIARQMAFKIQLGMI